MTRPTRPNGAPASALGTAAMLLALSAAFHFVWLGRHPFTDEGSVCRMALELLDGRRLYSEVWNEKTPLHFALTAFWFAVFGPGVESLRLLASFEMFVVLAILYRLCGSFRWLAVAAALLLGPWYHAHHGLQEATLAPLALLAIWASASGSTAGLMVAGVLGATGVWVKQTFASFFAAFLGASVRTIAVIGTAAVAASSAYLAVLYLHAGDGLWLMPPFGERSAALPHVILSWSEDKTLLLVHALGLGLLLWMTLRGTDDVLTRRLAVAALWVALPGMLRPGVHRVWPSAVLAIAAGARLLTFMPAPMRRRLGTAALCVVMTGGALRWMIRDWSYDRFEVVAQRIVSLTSKDDPIWVGPHESLLYCMAGRLSATRYDAALPWAPSQEGKTQLLADLRADPPKLIVDAGPLYHPIQGWLSQALPGVEELLAQRYRKLESLEGFDLYLRADVATQR